jgi:hypothetical protein
MSIVTRKRKLCFERLAIPKKLHFIWIGSNVPEKYIHHIFSFFNNTDYNITLWTDNENYYHKTLLELSMSHKLVIKNIKTVIEEIHVQVPNIIALTRFIWREMIGLYYNRAAAADILRLYILYIHGGIYIDVDIRTLLKFRGFGQLTCKHGVLYRSSGKTKLGGNNDIIASIPFSSLIKQMILTSLARYQANFELTWQSKREPETKYTRVLNILAKNATDIMHREDCLESKELIEIEKKIKVLNKSRVNGRINQTMYLTGPTLVCDVLTTALLTSSVTSTVDQLVSELAFPLTNLIISCDNNWKVSHQIYSIDN